MPFMLYDVALRGGATQYTYCRTVQIAGGGPLAALQRSLNTVRVTPFLWHATGDEVVAEIPGSRAGQQVVIDLKPNVANNVSLYRLLDVWGYSYADWTPIALRLETLFSDLHHDEPLRFKALFTVDPGYLPQVGEFLYLQGGTERGTWNWGRAGRVNGALLWKPAYDYLAGELGRALQ